MASEVSERPAAAVASTPRPATGAAPRTGASYPQVDSLAPADRSRARVWFVAATDAGSLCLALMPGTVPPRHAADAVVLLAGFELTLARLDSSQPEPLVWRWVPEEPVPAPGPVLLARDDGAAQLHLPWTWLQSRQAHAEARGAWADAFEWPSVPAIIHAGRLRLPPEELDELEPGGALIWPTSSQGPWRGSLVPEASPVALASVWLGPPTQASPWAPRLWPQRDPGQLVEWHGDVSGRLCELRLPLAAPLASRRLAGGVEVSDLDALSTRGRAELWQCAEGPHAECVLALGQLVPWGDVWALVIDSLACEAAAGVKN